MCRSVSLAHLQIAALLLVGNAVHVIKARQGDMAVVCIR